LHCCSVHIAVECSSAIHSLNLHCEKNSFLPGVLAVRRDSANHRRQI
jgi:hypothetical protein